MRVATTVAADSDARSGSLQAAEEDIEERLLSEAQEGWKHQLRAVAGQSRPPSAASRQGRHGYHHNARPSRGDSEPPLSPAQKVPPNLSAEQDRKHAKRTRSALQFLSDSITRTHSGTGTGTSFLSPYEFQPQEIE
ncbi:unnamed protein product, partial [Ectocarpus sp. 12 AP-2014]